jgi:hypothetical protein
MQKRIFSLILLLLGLTFSAGADVVRKGGIGVGDSKTWTGQQTFRDNKFSITDDSDTTKVVDFQLSGITTGNTSTLTVPQGDFTIGGLSLAQVWSSTNTFGSAADAANSVRLGETAGAIVGEGSSADAFELTLAFGDPTADVTVTVPSTLTGTLPIAAQPITFAGPTQARTVTFLDASGTVPFVGSNNTWSASQTLNSSLIWTVGANTILQGGSNGGTITFTRSGLTPDGPQLLSGTASNSWHLSDVGDANFDFNNGPCGTAACAHPALITHSSTQDTTNYSASFYYGVAGKAIKTLTESTDTSIVRIPVAASTGVGGTITATIFAADASDFQTLTATIQYAAVNKAGTETCSVPTALGTPLNSNSAGTLTCTLACSTSPTNAVDIQFNCTSSLTQTTLEAYWQINHVGAGEPAPQ